MQINQHATTNNQSTGKLIDKQPNHQSLNPRTTNHQPRYSPNIQHKPNQTTHNHNHNQLSHLCLNQHTPPNQSIYNKHPTRQPIDNLPINQIQTNQTTNQLIDRQPTIQTNKLIGRQQLDNQSTKKRPTNNANKHPITQQNNQQQT